MKEKIQSLNNLIFKNKKIEMKDTILIVGSPRSGTTWLMDIISNIPGYTYLFEPLNPIWFPESYEVGFRSRTYLKPESNWQEGENYLEKIFTGNIANLPIKDNPIFDLLYGFSFKNLIDHFYANKLIVKSINMNRMLPWIAKFFRLKAILFIIRHPCASIASQLNSGLYGYRSSAPPFYDVPPKIDDILQESSEIKYLDKNIQNLLGDIKTKEEVLAASWCLDNYIPLLQSKPYPWTTIFYEKLVVDGENEIKRIFKNLDIKNIPNSAFNQLKKPSIVTLKEDEKFIKKPNEQVSKWKKYLSEKEIQKILKIVSYFNLDFYSSAIEPIYDKIN